MNMKLALVSVVVLLIVLSGCAQQPAAPQPAEPAAPAVEEPAPALEKPVATPPALPVAQAATGACQTLVAKLQDLSAKGFPTGLCNSSAVYLANFNLDVDENRKLDAADLEMAQAHQSDDQWCSMRLNRTLDKENPCLIEYFEFPTCGAKPMRGDLNGDGKVDKKDAGTLTIYAAIATYPKRAGEFKFYPIQGNQCCMDVDGDGSLTGKDTSTINKIREGVKDPQSC